MITKDLVLKLFEGFSIERWTDLVRPFELIEMDKSAEKMVLAYIIGKFEEKKGHSVDWDWMIHASLFELFRKIALCDIKSPLQRRIRTDYPDEYRRLNEWVASQYKDIIKDEDLYNRFYAYVTESAEPEKETHISARIFNAAHKFSALREFEMIAGVNERYRLKNIEKELNADIRPFLDLEGLQLLVTKQRPYEFLMVLEQLRFQVRWNQTPRVPKTTVLGHSFFVAIVTLLLARCYEKSCADMGIAFTLCPKRRFNNFFSALFHDLPEAVTRDIISPVKQATDTLPSVVKLIEAQTVESDLKPLMEDIYADELMYFTGDEFENRVLVDGQSQAVSFEDLNTRYNEDRFSPVDGRLVRIADHIAAFVEADSSIRYGITSVQLESGRKNLLELYPEGKIINGFEPASFFAFFS
ncbi:HD domain-containing protein [Treponema sp. OMZ 840]|uniref:HD domain-containing protein n=1 Tax=Treponema sp. OMZ 840 TaxID=244313 RepID=UPI003D9319D8